MKDPKRLERYQLWVNNFTSESGQKVLGELKRMTGQDSTSLTQSIVDGKVDPYYTIYQEGRRSVWLDIERNLTEPPDMPEEGGDEDENG